MQRKLCSNWRSWLDRFLGVLEYSVELGHGYVEIPFGCYASHDVKCGSYKPCLFSSTALEFNLDYQDLCLPFPFCLSISMAR